MEVFRQRNFVPVADFIRLKLNFIQTKKNKKLDKIMTPKTALA